MVIYVVFDSCVNVVEELFFFFLSNKQQFFLFSI